MKRRSTCIVLAMVCLLGSQARASTPYVANCWGPDSPGGQGTIDLAAPTGFVDIPRSVRVIENVPAGTAVITWSMVGGGVTGSSLGNIRPAIGGIVPDNPMPATFEQGVDHQYSGSWLTTTPGGSLSVSLQVEYVSGQPGQIRAGQIERPLSWTLVVYPDSAPLPAVGEWGTFVMVLLLLTAATAIFARRRAVAA